MIITCNKVGSVNKRKSHLRYLHTYTVPLILSVQLNIPFIYGHVRVKNQLLWVGQKPLFGLWVRIIQYIANLNQQYFDSIWLNIEEVHWSQQNIKPYVFYKVSNVWKLVLFVVSESIRMHGRIISKITFFYFFQYRLLI